MREQSSFALSLKKIDKVLGSVIQITCVALLAIMVLTISISILTRFVFFNPLNFADALAKYLMVWLAFLGSGLAIREGEHIVVDMFSNSLKNNARKKLILFINIIVSIFLVIIIYNGITFALSGIGSNDPFVFGISMIIPYLSVPIGFFYMLIQLNITTILSLLSTKIKT